MENMYLIKSSELSDKIELLHNTYNEALNSYNYVYYLNNKENNMILKDKSFGNIIKQIQLDIIDLLVSRFSTLVDAVLYVKRTLDDYTPITIINDLLGFVVELDPIRKLIRGIITEIEKIESSTDFSSCIDIYQAKRLSYRSMNTKRSLDLVNKNYEVKPFLESSKKILDISALLLTLLYFYRDVKRDGQSADDYKSMFYEGIGKAMIKYNIIQTDTKDVISEYNILMGNANNGTNEAQQLSKSKLCVNCEA